MHPALGGVQCLKNQLVKKQSVNSALWLSLPCQVGFWSYIFSFFPFFLRSQMCHPLRIHKSILLKIHVWLVLLSDLHLRIWCSQWCTANTVFIFDSACFHFPHAFGYNKGGTDNGQQLRGLRSDGLQYMDNNCWRVIHQENGLKNAGTRDVIGPWDWRVPPQGSLAVYVRDRVDDIVLLTLVWPQTSNGHRFNCAFCLF